MRRALIAVCAMSLFLLAVMALRGQDVVTIKSCPAGQYLNAKAQCACPTGQYLTMDGRCLKDRTGEQTPAGDGCNTITCMDPACRWSSTTEVYCTRPDDPAPPAPVKPDATLSTGPLVTTAISSLRTAVVAPTYPEMEMWCGKRLVGAIIFKADDKAYVCAATKKRRK